MKRALIIGCPGSGKNTFARGLRDKTGLPLYYLDLLWHKADKTTVTREEFDVRLSELMQNDRWIIDENYSRTLEMQLAACDTVFLMDYPTEVCLDGVMSRMGKPRVDMPWIETAVDPEFMQYIRDFSTQRLPRIYELLENYRTGREIIIFKSRSDADRFLRKLNI